MPSSSFPHRFDVHSAAPARHHNRSQRHLTLGGDELGIVAQGADVYRLIFTVDGVERNVVDCQWDKAARSFTGSLAIDGDDFYLEAHLVQALRRTYLMGILIPEASGDIDDPDATGGWTAQAQGGGVGGPPP